MSIFIYNLENGKKVNSVKLFNKKNNHIPTSMSLHGQDFIIGFTRLALDPKCYKCGNCFFGCPDNYIFNTKGHFNQLIKSKS